MTAHPSLFEDEARDASKSQWLTPVWLADRLAEWVMTHATRPMSVLEPSAGTGNLIAALARFQLPLSWLAAYEIDSSFADQLQHACDLLSCSHAMSTGPESGDFLAARVTQDFDLCVMNPPYEGNQDVAFVTRALEHCDRVVGIFASRILHSQGRAEFWRWHDVMRMAVLSVRPQFGGDSSPKTDFCALDIRRRLVPRKQGEASCAAIEWWSR